MFVYYLLLLGFLALLRALVRNEHTFFIVVGYTVVVAKELLGMNHSLHLLLLETWWLIVIVRILARV